MEIDLRHAVAIVTGAGRGIGREIASVLAAEGARSVALDVQEENLRALEQDFRAHGWEGVCWQCDVTSATEVEKIVAQVVENYGRVDVLVNNAGVAGDSPIDTMPEELWQLIIDVNLTGTFHMCRAVIPYMKQQGGGRIINAASYASITPSYGGGAYAASKAGVHYLTKVLAGELGPWNITANCYAPGMIPTEMNHFDKLPKDRQERLLDLLSLRRWGTKEEIARLVAFLASEAAGYITGSLIDISGGKLAVQLPQVAYEQVGGRV